MDRHAPGVVQSADRLAVANVHTDVLEVAPDDEVARLWVVAGYEAAVAEPGVVGLNAAVSADLVLQCVLVKDEPDVSNAIELVRALRVVDPRVAELGLGETEDLVELRGGACACCGRGDVRE